MKYLFYAILFLTYTVYSTIANEVEPPATLPPCRACKAFVESLKKGIARTEKGRFEGGDTAWEEEKLGKYATSEIRLTEIQESLCADLTEGKIQCYALVEEFDADIEEWWFHKQDEEADIFHYFCIKVFKNCCPDNHYGPDCKPCEGFPDNICSGNGKCRGAGTRKGNGTCFCDAGYIGDKCDNCAGAYYESYRDEKKILCSKCHISCDGNCSKAGPDGCAKCRTGWILDTDKGCLDLNECAETKSPCGPRQFCVNTEGSFKCLDCDRSCSGCTGDGPDMCTHCAKGYILRDNMCVDAEQESRQSHVFFTRYLTYLGLCIATYIIFNKNTVVAAIIGIAVAVYISLSEYMLNTPFTPKIDNIAKNFVTT